MNQLGQYFHCVRDGCTSTPVCMAQCESKGYSKGGVCRIYSFGGACCCQCDSKCDPWPISSPSY